MLLFYQYLLFFTCRKNCTRSFGLHVKLRSKGRKNCNLTLSLLFQHVREHKLYMCVLLCHIPRDQTSTLMKSIYKEIYFLCMLSNIGFVLVDQLCEECLEVFLEYVLVVAYLLQFNRFEKFSTFFLFQVINLSTSFIRKFFFKKQRSSALLYLFVASIIFVLSYRKIDITTLCDHIVFFRRCNCWALSAVIYI